MKIVFLTLLYNKDNIETYDSYLTKAYPNSGNTFQYALLDGFNENNYLKNIYLINSLPFGSYKKGYNKLVLGRERFIYNGYDIGVTIPCINFQGIKQYTRYIYTYRELNKYIKENAHEQILILTYNDYLPYMKACYKIVKKYANVSFCPIIADMPGQYGKLPSSGLSRKFFLWECKVIFKYFKRAKKFILLSKNSSIPLQLDNNYIVMEGIFSVNDSINYDTRMSENNKKIIFYSGALDKQYGILHLIEAFNKLSNYDVELWICGANGHVEEVKLSAKNNSRIKYLGSISRKEVIMYQKFADLLVNPRPNEGEYVKYSFPSKTMEYLASGTPTLMFKLDGIPDEYDDYLNYFTDDNIENMAEDMKRILFDDSGEYMYKAQKAKEFILTQKNSKVQVKRILDFLEERYENSSD